MKFFAVIMFAALTARADVASDKIHMLLQMASNGNVRVQNALAWQYMRSTNAVEAMRWWRIAAEQGYSAAALNLGEAYFQGWGGATNHVEAVKWYTVSSDMGCADAQLSLADCHENGYGVATNRVKALELYKSAADQGVAEAKREYDRLRTLLGIKSGLESVLPTNRIPESKE